MDEQKIEEKQVRLLSNAASYKTRTIVRTCLGILSCTFLISGGYKFFLVRKISNAVGFVFRDLFAEPNFLEMYSGAYLMATRQLYEGFIDWIVFLVLCALWGSFEYQHKTAKVLLRMIVNARDNQLD